MAARRRNGVIGRSVLRKEDRPLLTGSGCFVDDLDLPGTAHAAILRSPHAHASLESIDASQALAMPGVLDVVTADDVPPEIRIPMRMYPLAGMEPYLQPPLARGVARYSGEPVAVVVAESRYLAEDAAERVAVAYEPLPAILDPEGALAEDANALFAEPGTNLAAGFEVAYGEVDEAFESAALVVEERIVCQRHAAVPLEPRGIAAELDRRAGTLLVWGAAKVVQVNRRILAGLLGWPEERVRLVELDVGGGFGSRGEFYPEDYLIPFCALRLGRPVKWTADREEDLRSTNHSREQLHEIALALGADGEFLAMRDRVTFNTGAYVRTHGTVVPSMTAGLLPGPYDWGAYRCQVRQTVTNKTPAGTYRSPGRYEANLARERMIDLAARRLELDPAELRRRNLIPKTSMPYSTGTHTGGHPVAYDSGDYELLFGKALGLFGYEEMLAWRGKAADGGRRRGLGLAFFVEKSAIAQWDYARVGLNSVGKAVVHAGSASVGQGVETVLAQICADGLGLSYDEVAEVRHGDTDEVPDGMGAFGSRATAMAGAAVLQASEALRERILAIAAELLEADAGDLEIADGRIAPRGSPGRGVSLAEVAEAARPVNALRRNVDPGLSQESYFFSEDMSFPYGVHCAAVEIDVETGGLRIERYAIAYDVGRAVNPMLIEGQIVGGAAQGIGGALLEELSYGADGQLVAGSFMDYLLPTAGEVPALRVLVTEDAPSPLSPFGAKGAGEGGTAAAGAVIANAVSDAVGVEALALPLTPERVVGLAREGELGGARRGGPRTRA
ncbi:MAG: molybdopterin-dependent oxidoreductase [Solirubrobacterales bacterium]|nr:molybdopterin-dependent oxidoreductase [Solirubrobacterales bacterium]